MTVDKDRTADLLGKVLMALLAVVVSMAGWWVREMTLELRSMREEMRRLDRVAAVVELMAGGDPLAGGDDGEEGRSDRSEGD